MKLTKYRHACVVLENQGAQLVIDPGVFTEDLGELTNVAGIVITHVHPDHCDPQHIAAIMRAAPTAKIYSTAEVATRLQGYDISIVKHGDVVELSTFTLDFFGGEHAAIHPSIPKNQNIGVFVNGDFYYPGDSFTIPEDSEVPLLALPVSAPWLKISEVMDFVAAVKPANCFATHNAILSPEGQGIIDNLIGRTCQQQGTTYLQLQPGDSTEI